MRLEELLPSSNPILNIKYWLDTATSESQLPNPNAVVLATQYKNEVSSRVVLIKEIDEHGLYFYSNYKSDKGLELENNPYCNINFFWDTLGRQIRVKAKVEKTSRAKSESYWQTRLRQSQLSQTASQQSRPIPSQEHLDQLVLQLDKEYGDRPIPCPKDWGGYKASPYNIEFWLADVHRQHQRLRFEKDPNNQWLSIRLAP